MSDNGIPLERLSGLGCAQESFNPTNREYQKPTRFFGGRRYSATAEQSTPQMRVIHEGAQPQFANKQAVLNAARNSNAPMTKADLVKAYVDIDRQFLRNAIKKRKSFHGLSGAELGSLDDLLTATLNSDLTDADIDNQFNDSVAEDLQGMGYAPVGDLGKGFFKKIAAKVKTVTKKVAAVAKKVVNAAVKAVKTVVNLPRKAAGAAALAVLKGRLSKALVYGLIPDGSPVLAKYPKVAEKRIKQRKFISGFAKITTLKESYILKHLHNSISSEVNPDLFIKQLSQKKRKGIEGLGAINWDSVISAVSAIPVYGQPAAALLKSLIGDKAEPVSEDFPAPIEESTSVIDAPVVDESDNGTADGGAADGGAADGGAGTFWEKYKMPVIIGTTVLVGGVIVAVGAKKKKK